MVELETIASIFINFKVFSEGFRQRIVSPCVLIRMSSQYPEMLWDMDPCMLSKKALDAIAMKAMKRMVWKVVMLRIVSII